jgi:hypothetical protein
MLGTFPPPFECINLRGIERNAASVPPKRREGSLDYPANSQPSWLFDGSDVLVSQIHATSNDPFRGTVS